MGEPRVPIADDEFNNYIHQTNTYLFTADPIFVTNWQRLGLLAAEATQWDTYKNDWNAKYAITQSNIANNIRNATATQNKNQARTDFTDWVTDRELNKLNRIGASPNVTNADRAIFRIALRDETRTVHTAPIEAEMFFDMKPISGGDMRLRCREQVDSTRASIPAEANAVELRWVISNNAPNSVDDCPDKEIFTEALFNYNFGAGNTAKKIFAFARWIDTTNKNRSGHWSDMVQTVIV